MELLVVQTLDYKMDLYRIMMLFQLWCLELHLRLLVIQEGMLIPSLICVQVFIHYSFIFSKSKECYYGCDSCTNGANNQCSSCITGMTPVSGYCKCTDT